MFEVSGYQILQKIFQGRHSAVYKGLKLENEQKVIIKTLDVHHVSDDNIKKLQIEFALGASVNSAHTVRYIEKVPCIPQGLAIIQEDDEAITLKQYLKNKQLQRREFLTIAIQLMHGLHDMHQADIVHRDINPNNIIIIPELLAVKYIDFGSAAPLRQVNQQLLAINNFEGTLAYISPEQTGRINRHVDYRTDYYSLGLTFYEMLCGCHPIQSKKSLELIHFHLAKNLIPPHELNAEIPRTLSAIIMKMLAKDMEERYQSCHGIIHDLGRCLEELNEHEDISAFQIAEKDFSEKFQIPQKLYGREQELKQLLAAFGRVRDGTMEIAMVAGLSGIGKTSLVNELQTPVAISQGYFISGKFDQLNRNLAYSAFSQAFQGLLKQILTEPEENIQSWKNKLQAALGSNGQLLIELIPNLEYIIGKQPPKQESGLQEAENRFNAALQNFIKVFCQPGQPLVLFLDDLQWADLASLNLIMRIVKDQETRNLFFVGAYRDNEVDATHPTILALENIKKARIEMVELVLAPLKQKSVRQWIANALNMAMPAIAPLAELIFHKTGANPFFVRMFLQLLYDEQLITLSSDTGWTWDIEQVRVQSATDNIVEFMLRRISQLDPAVAEILKSASCLGNNFILKKLANVSKISLEELINELNPVLNNLVFIIGEHFYFAHDRVQEAFNLLIPEQIKAEKHLMIGYSLLGNYSLDNLEQEDLFEIVDHLNKANKLIIDREQRLQIAQLNFAAGKKAQEAIAYQAALDYLENCLNYLKDIDIWSDEYAFALVLYKTLAEVEYLNSHFAKSEELIANALDRLQTVVDKAEFYNLLIIQNTMQGRYQAAMELGCTALNLLDVSISLEALPELIRSVKISVQKKLEHKEIATLINLPEIMALKEKAALKLFFNLYIVGYLTGSELLQAVILLMVDFSLTYGHAPESCLGYAGYGMLLCSTAAIDNNQTAMDTYKTGYEFGQLAISLSDKFTNLVQKCRAYNLIVNCIFSWSQPIHYVNTLIDEGFQAGIAAGELQYAGYLLQYKARSLLDQGLPLAALARELVALEEFCRKTSNQIAIDLITSVQITVNNLLGNTVHELNFEFGNINDKQYIKHCTKVHSLSAVCLYQFMKAQVLYLYGYLDEALEHLQLVEKQFVYIPGQYTIANHNWYYSLILTALYAKMPAEIQQSYLENLEKNQRKLKQWAKSCPENFLHKYQLIEAEIARIKNQYWRAAGLYRKAVNLVRNSKFIQELAIACELTAKFWLLRKDFNCAQGYFNEAYNAYYNWGANHKLKVFCERYQSLLNPRVFANLSPLTTLDQTTISLNSLAQLDLSSILEASQTISSEIELDKLLINIMRIMVANVGAQQAALFLLDNSDKPLLQAEYLLDERIETLQNIVLHEWENGCRSIISYVQRTQQPVLLGNAQNDRQFSHDSYIVASHAKSILCLPIIKQNNLKCILYVGNNLVTDAFTKQHMDVLIILASQMAISLENAFNIKEQIKVAEEIASQTARAVLAEKHQKELEDFIDHICHELRNPLSGIQGNVELLGIGIEQREAVLNDPEVIISAEQRERLIKQLVLDRESVEAIETCAYRQKVITDEVLNLSKLAAGKFELQHIEFNPKEILTAAIKMFEAQAKRKNLRLHLNFPVEDVHIVGDPDRLSQIIINLLANAVKFTKAGSIKLEFDVLETTAEHTTLQILIKDTGIGMSIEEQTHLFQRFEQASAKTFHKYGGSGLGLFISKKLVELMGGEITVKSSKGKGTKFSFTIKGDTAKVPITAESISFWRSPVFCRTQSPQPNRSGPPGINRILIVEDNEINQTVIMRLLEKAGYKCQIANNGREAIAIINESANDEPFDLIFMDIQMPIMDGITATLKIREQEKAMGTKRIPIIGLSGNARNEHVVKAQECGMDDYLIKPVKKEVLYEVIARFDPASFAVTAMDMNSAESTTLQSRVDLSAKS